MSEDVPIGSEEAQPHLLVEAYEAMSVGVRELRRQIDLVSEKLEAGHNSQDASHLAFLVEKLANAMRELRMHEKHEKDSAADMTPEEEDQCLVTWLCTLPTERRRRYLPVVDEAQRSVL